MRTLLLADESITVQRVIALTFAAEQIQVVTVGDGQQAIDKMASLQPDIVLAGTTLPQVSGYDLARYMRGKAELQGVPVLLLTGAFETVDEARLASSGANGVLEKPVEPTVVINRVKELLGIKSDEKPAAPGRQVTPPAGAAKKPPLPPLGKRPPLTPPPPRTPDAPKKFDQLKNQSGLAANTKSVEDASTKSGDYLDTLDAAFDNLDQQLSGRAPAAKSPRNPAGPLGQSGGAADPRSPGRSPSPASSTTGNPVFEVDDEWFGDADSQSRADARAGRREIAEDLNDPDLTGPAKADAPVTPVFEVDDEWFAEDNKARAAKAHEQELLAQEMGINDVEFADVVPAVGAPAPAADLDFDYGLDDLKGPASKTDAPEPTPAAVKSDPPPPDVRAQAPPVHKDPEPPPPQVAHVTEAPIAKAPEPIAKMPEPPVAREPEMPASIAPMAAVPQIAEDFEALLAYERGERSHPPAPPPPEIKMVAPDVTDEMLEEVTSRVVERLTAGAFGNALREAVIASMRDGIRSVVADTSERLIRDAAPSVVAETSDRIVRDTVHAVVTEASDRMVRDAVPGIVAEASERMVRDAVPDVVWTASERFIHETVPGVVAETSERLIRDAVQNVVGEAVERQLRETVPAVVAETSERVIRDAVFVVAVETSERLARETVPPVVVETADRVVRDTVPAVVAETADRHVRDIVRGAVSETTERMVRDEIDRIKSKIDKA